MFDPCSKLVYNKICSKCHKAQEHTQFHARLASTDGLQATCKTCTKAYDKARLQKPEVKARNKALKKVHLNTNAGRKQRKKATNKYLLSYPEKKSAHNAVAAALHQGRLTKADYCVVCSSEGPLEAHHESYADEDQLDVVWLCNNCHRGVHNV